MKKICFFVGDLNQGGGTERVALLIANGLVLKGYDVTFLNLFDGKRPFFDISQDIRNDYIYDKKISMKKNFLTTIKKIREYVNINEIDIFISVDSILCVYSTPALMRIKIKHICWEHFNFKITLGSFFRKLGRRLAASFCDNVIVLTKQDVSLWEKSLKFIKADIKCIPNPKTFNPIYIKPNLDSRNILAIGRLDKIKGFDLLINAFSNFNHKKTNWTLTLIGSGVEKDNLLEVVKNLKLEEKVIFIEATKDLEPYFRSSSFLCCSSIFEGFGMVILEAMSFGLPVVSFDCDTGPREILSSNEGILVGNINAEDLSIAMLKISNISFKDYENMSMNAYLKSNKFSLENILIYWMEIL